MGTEAEALEEYAAQVKFKGRCWTCRIFEESPELAEAIRAARARRTPTTFTAIAGFLADKHGLEISSDAVQKHFAKHEVSR
jgi:hypothetical protein